jgi:hypothetical protein
MSKLNKVRLNWKALLVLIAIAWAINAAAITVDESVDLEPWTGALVLIIADLSYTAFIILILVGSAYLALQGVKLLMQAFPDIFRGGNEMHNGNLAVVPEARDVAGTLDNLSRRLDEVEGNRDQAVMKLQDADVLASTLVGLIRQAVGKARDLEQEGQALYEALNAWASGDQVAIAKAAGALNDDHIRSLMLETRGDDSYRDSILNLIATQTGVLRSSSQTLKNLSNAWVASLTDQRAKTARLSVVVDILDAARPLTSINAKLLEAQGYLMMQDQPDLHQVTRALPAGSQQLIGYK